MCSVALQRLEGHKRSPERSSSSPRSKEKGSAKSTGRKEGDDPSYRRESLLKLEQGRSGVDQKVDRIQPAETNQDLQPIAKNNCKKGLQISSMTILGLVVPDQGTMILSIEKSLEVLIRNQEENMKHMQRLEEKIN